MPPGLPSITQQSRLQRYARLIPLDSAFEGFVSDVPRNKLSGGQCYRMVDFIPNLGAPARKRGGWKYSSVALGSQVSAMGWFRKITGTTEHLIYVCNNGRVYKDTAFDGTGGTSVGSLGVSGVMTQNLLYWLGFTIIPKPGAAGGFSTWNGTALAAGIVSYKTAAPWGDFLVVGNKPTDATQLAWASTATAIIAGSTWQMPSEVIAIAGFPRQIIVWGYSDAWTLIGEDPPPGGNMQMKTLFSGNGIMDQRSLVATSNFAIWANSTGIYMTEGTTATDITAQGGISNYWRDIIRGFNLAAGWSAAGGMYLDWYIISVTDATDTLVVTLAFNTRSRRWIRLQNIDSVAFARRPGGAAYTEELFFARGLETRTAYLSPLWTPGASNQSDGDGVGVLPYLETPFYILSGGAQQRFKSVHTQHHITTTSGAPSLKVGFVTDPDDPNYTFSSYQLLPSAQKTTTRSDIRRKARGIGFRIEQTAPSDDTKLFGLELEMHSMWKET